MDYTDLRGKIAVFEGAGKVFEVKEYPVTPPRSGMALLRLLASGICGTDLHIHHGRLLNPSGIAIGHEFIGEIADINDGDGTLKVGDRVIYNMAKPCGKCKLCETGDSANCLSFEVAYVHDVSDAPHFFGGYGEYCYASTAAGTLIKIPDSVETFAAALFPCAGPTILHALKLGGIFDDAVRGGIETAVVQGAGPLGMFSALWLKLHGVKNIYVAGRSKSSPRMKSAEAMTGAKLCTENEIKDMAAGGLSVDLCIECSGNPEAFVNGCNILRNRGVYLVPGQYSDSGSVRFSPELITFKALRIYGSSQYDASDVADYIKFLGENAETVNKFAPLVAAYEVDKINDAIEAADEHLYTKVVLTHKQ